MLFFSQDLLDFLSFSVCTDCCCSLTSFFSTSYSVLECIGYCIQRQYTFNFRKYFCYICFDYYYFYLRAICVSNGDGGGWVCLSLIAYPFQKSERKKACLHSKTHTVHAAKGINLILCYFSNYFPVFLSSLAVLFYFCLVLISPSKKTTKVTGNSLSIWN